MVTSAKEPKRGHRPAHGEGSFYYADGAWRGVYEAGLTDNGTRRRVTASAKDEDAAWQKFLARKKDYLLHGAPAEGVRAGETVQGWSKEWLAAYHDSGVRPRVYATVRSRVDRHIVPTLGKVRIDALTAVHMRQLAAGVRRRGGGATTAGHVQRTLVQMLNDARAAGHTVPDRILAARRVSPGRSARVAPSVDALVSILRQAWTSPDHSRWDMALMQGLRQGEALGLTWDRVDLEAGLLDISWQLQALPYADRSAGVFDVHPDIELVHLSHALHLTRPKTSAGERTIPMIPEMVEVMQRWRELAPSSPWGLVWPRVDGRPRNTQHDLAEWKRLQDEAGAVKDASLPVGATGRYFVGHELRHATISLLTAAGVSPHVVEQIVGQTELVKAYVHTDTEQLRVALTNLRGLLGQIGT